MSQGKKASLQSMTGRWMTTRMYSWPLVYSGATMISCFLDLTLMLCNSSAGSPWSSFFTACLTLFTRWLTCGVADSQTPFAEDTRLKGVKCWQPGKSPEQFVTTCNRFNWWLCYEHVRFCLAPLPASLSYSDLSRSFGQIAPQRSLVQVTLRTVPSKTQIHSHIVSIRENTSNQARDRRLGVACVSYLTARLAEYPQELSQQLISKKQMELGRGPEGVPGLDYGGPGKDLKLGNHLYSFRKILIWVSRRF